MKKMINTSFAYLIAGLVGGVFYREFTKFQGFTGFTRLSLIHPHLLVLGMILSLIVALFFVKFDLDKKPKWNRFYITYNLGVITTTLMLLVRGLTEVLNISLSSGMSAAISGLAGLSHIILTVGIMYLFTLLRNEA
ncbi:DUF2871 domain-containing protein [Erysipelothrix amsterdamensis]|uniref:DUF2871 domain-containing protein n=1 Tax=Erysipelothrix amsterdamensis TaxID=2929157 RepID=A0AAU9VMJ5_9FIRM|nr:DUF2871 domain-containing protein [Erysipelothrix rhusiopathiae]CAH2763211.1 DUF2871 domain-containing protein [Erysipelothrix sp. A18Y020d]AYV34284.1 DUF2871 domain-containing protein [Erysipelothrix rhusiopathiae]MDE8117644.1 DUF2871 domain-containing protein [Erysipelothrix rhusiopathiae]MDE8202001.1 DUF2871 domain-containing protein [Erysipelothrix rhusiopathiae]MDE8288017.1 DUF2871 domain-containing protein [Erysipelothrix rhusiopathiae]